MTRADAGANDGAATVSDHDSRRADERSSARAAMSTADAKAVDKAEKDRVAHRRGMDQGMSVLSYLLGGIGFYGLLGWLGDHFLHTNFLLAIGVVIGAALSVYVIIKRFGDLGSKPATTEPPASGEEK